MKILIVVLGFLFMIPGVTTFLHNRPISIMCITASVLFFLMLVGVPKRMHAAGIILIAALSFFSIGMWSYKFPAQNRAGLWSSIFPAKSKEDEFIALINQLLATNKNMSANYRAEMNRADPIGAISLLTLSNPASLDSAIARMSQFQRALTSHKARSRELHRVFGYKAKALLGNHPDMVDFDINLPYNLKMGKLLNIHNAIVENAISLLTLVKQNPQEISFTKTNAVFRNAKNMEAYNNHLKNIHVLLRAESKFFETNDRQMLEPFTQEFKKFFESYHN